MVNSIKQTERRFYTPQQIIEKATFHLSRGFEGKKEAIRMLETAPLNNLKGPECNNIYSLLAQHYIDNSQLENELGSQFFSSRRYIVFKRVFNEYCDIAEKIILTGTANQLQIKTAEKYFPKACFYSGVFAAIEGDFDKAKNFLNDAKMPESSWNINLDNLKRAVELKDPKMLKEKVFAEGKAKTYYETLMSNLPSEKDLIIETPSPPIISAPLTATDVPKNTSGLTFDKLIQRGSAAFKNKNNKEALKYLKQALEIFDPEKDNTLELIQLASLYSIMGQFKEAIKVIGLVSNYNPGNTSVISRFAKILRFNGLIHEAYAILNYMENLPDIKKRGGVIGKEEIEELAGFDKDKVPADPTKIFEKYGISYKAAPDEISSRGSQQPTPTSGTRTFLTLTEEGEKAFYAEEKEKAYELYLEAFGIFDPKVDEPKKLTNLICLYQMKEEFEKAIELTRAILSLRPGNSYAIMFFADTLLSMGKIHEAYSIYDYLNRNPHFSGRLKGFFDARKAEGFSMRNVPDHVKVFKNYRLNYRYDPAQKPGPFEVKDALPATKVEPVMNEEIKEGPITLKPKKELPAQKIETPPEVPCAEKKEPEPERVRPLAQPAAEPKKEIGSAKPQEPLPVQPINTAAATGRDQIPLIKQLDNVRATFLKGQIAEAFALLENISASFPYDNKIEETVDFLIKEAKQLEFNRRYKEASISFLYLLKLRGNDPDLFVDYMRISYKAGFKDNAYNMLNLALKNFPDDFKIYTIAGNIALWDKNFPLAKERFEKAIEIRPNAFAAILGLARTFTNTKQYALAVDHYKMLIKEYPTTRLYLKELALLAREMEDLKMAEQILNFILSNDSMNSFALESMEIIRSRQVPVKSDFQIKKIAAQPPAAMPPKEETPKEEQAVSSQAPEPVQKQRTGRRPMPEDEIEKMRTNVASTVNYFIGQGKEITMELLKETGLFSIVYNPNYFGSIEKLFEYIKENFGPSEIEELQEVLPEMKQRRGKVPLTPEIIEQKRQEIITKVKGFMAQGLKIDSALLVKEGLYMIVVNPNYFGSVKKLLQYIGENPQP